MGEALTEQDLQYQKERQHRNKVLALVGLFLLILGLAGWVVSMTFSIPSTSPITKTIPSSYVYIGRSGGGGCEIRLCVDPSSIYFIIPQGQSNQYVQTIALSTDSQTSWSGMTVTSQGSNWLSISPTKGNLNSVGIPQITIALSSNILAVGMYHGIIKLIAQGGLIANVDVYVEVIPAYLKNLVAYTPASDLTIVASWPHLIKDHAVNITLSLLSQNLSRDLPRAPTLAKLVQTSSSGGLDPYSTDPAPTDFGSDDLPLKIALQPEFPELMTVSARLYGTSFDMSPIDPFPQTPYQRIVSFHWNILPKEVGLQGFAVDFGGQWKDKEDPPERSLRHPTGTGRQSCRR